MHPLATDYASLEMLEPRVPELWGSQGKKEAKVYFLQGSQSCHSLFSPPNPRICILPSHITSAIPHMPTPLNPSSRAPTPLSSGCFVHKQPGFLPPVAPKARTTVTSRLWSQPFPRGGSLWLVHFGDIYHHLFWV